MGTRYLVGAFLLALAGCRSSGTCSPCAPQDAPIVDDSAPWVKIEVDGRELLVGIGEVSNLEFLRFVSNTNYRSSAERMTSGVMIWSDARGKEELAVGPTWRTVNRAKANWDVLPVTGISGEDAKAYAEWIGGRLPTTAEMTSVRIKCCRSFYETAQEQESPPVIANVADMSFFGRWFDFEKAHYQLTRYDDGFSELAPCASLQADECGCSDLIGNVSEICIDAKNGQYMVAGGAWRETPTSGFLDAAKWRHAQLSDSVGFRCIFQTVAKHK